MFHLQPSPHLGRNLILFDVSTQIFESRVVLDGGIMWLKLEGACFPLFNLFKIPPPYSKLYTLHYGGGLVS